MRPTLCQHTSAWANYSSFTVWLHSYLYAGVYAPCAYIYSPYSKAGLILFRYFWPSEHIQCSSICLMGLPVLEYIVLSGYNLRLVSQSPFFLHRLAPFFELLSPYSFLTCIDSTFSFHWCSALWFPIVGNKEVGTTIVVVYRPEATLHLGLSKFGLLQRFIFFPIRPQPATKVRS